jgi:hypothetical protein
MFEAKEIVYQSKDWITIIFFVVFCVLTVVKVLFNNRLPHTATLLLSKKYLLVYFNKEKNNILSLFQLLMFFVQLLALSLILYFAQIHFQLSTSNIGFKHYVYIAFGVLMYFGLRYLVGLFLAIIFNLKSEHSKLSYDKVNYFNNLILWIIPFLLLSTYTSLYNNLFFKITFYLFTFLLVIRYVLVLVNNKNLIFSNLFYFILYLCALEIAPLIIILKLTI